MKNKRVYYFAYGSNMSVDRIFERVGKVFVKGAYLIKGYTLLFNCGHPPYNLYGNMVQSSNGKIEGVLYELSEEQIHRLDFYECYPNNYDKIYFYDDEKDAIIFAYVATKDFCLRPSESGKPQLDYINHLLKGAAEFSLKNTYDFLMDYKVNNYKLKNVRAFDEEVGSYKKGKSSFKVRGGKVVERK